VDSDLVPDEIERDVDIAARWSGYCRSNQRLECVRVTDGVERWQLHGRVSETAATVETIAVQTGSLVLSNDLR
jgi:hypothetical protein